MTGRTRKRTNLGEVEAQTAVGKVIGAAIAFRQGHPVAIRNQRHWVMAQAVETMDQDALRELRAGVLLLAHPRATTLKIRIYTPEVVALPLEPEPTVECLRAIADPTFDLSEPMKGPFFPLRKELPVAFAASVKLAKLAGLLPATVASTVERVPAGVPQLSVDDVRNFERQSIDTLKVVTRAHVPLEGAERAELVAFRARDGGPEHYAILVNAPPPHMPVLTRLHSECFTGDLLGSLKCDCGLQLRGAIKAISQTGGGILLYLAQEGRGIGLTNKLRAYRLQDQGFDTSQANERLGFESDERLYGLAAKMLGLLGYGAVRLLTNNPEKVAALEAVGIKVTERVRHHFPANAHNRAYLKAKAKAGHLL